MTEKKKTAPASRRRSTTAARSARGRKPAQKDLVQRFFEGYGNEFTGVIFIGFGLLLTAGIFSDRTGRVGEFLKDLAIATFGSLGYIFPVMFLGLGLAFILRKRDFLMNRRTLGVILVIFSMLIVLSVGHMYRLETLSLSDALRQMSLLRDRDHGGVLGFLLTYPLVKLVGEVGAYIFAFLGVILGMVLFFNTTLYDSLHKGRQVTGQVHSRINDFREKNNELRALEVTAADKGMADPAPARGKRTFKNTPGNRPEDPRSRETFLKAPTAAAEPADDKLTLPSFLAGAPRSAHLVDGRREGFDRYNIELKTEGAATPAAKAKVRAGTGKSKAGGKDLNPITVPYLENWNKVRDEKNPRSRDQLPVDELGEEDGTAEAAVSAADREDQDFDRVFTPGDFSDGEDSGDIHSEAAPEVEPAHQELKKLTEAEFQEYRRKKLAQTEKPERLKGTQVVMEHPEDKKKPEYKYPGVALLKENMRGMMGEEDHQEILENARKLQDTLATFGVEARVIDVSKGPSVTRYEMQLKAGIKVSKVTNLADDIAMSLAAMGVRIEAPIPGKAAVGIEVPNRETVPVYLREVIDSEKFSKSTQKLAMGLGKDISGDIIIGDIAKFPHVLIAGATGSGKSVCINSLIVSLLYKYTPEEVRLIMIDPKMVELSVYNGIPHLLIPVVTDPKKAAGALNWAVNEMTRRYDLFNTNSVRNIEGYNDLKAKGRIEEKLPYIVIVVDELADLMMVAAGEVESYIARLAQMARAAGMHLVIATQRPSVDVITGVIKANIPSRISFAVSSYVDSKTILDQGGAEKLLGKGDMLYSPMGAHKPKRVQGAFITEEEVEAIVAHIKVREDEVRYDESIIEHIEKGGSAGSGDDEEADELFEEAVRVVLEYNQASTSFLQRRMRIGYNRAARIMDDLEQKGVISGPDGAKPRRVLWTAEDVL